MQQLSGIAQRCAARVLAVVPLAMRLAMLGGWVACAVAAQPRPQPDAQVQVAMALSADAERGKAAYAECVRCHRRDAWDRINGSVPRLSGQHASVILKQMIARRAGRRFSEQMKANLDEEPMSNQTLVDLAAYLQSLPMAPRVGRGPGDQLEKGQALYEKDCATCHGAQGQGDAARWRPMLASQHYLYLLSELKTIAKGERGASDPDMLKLLKGFSEEDLQSIADHLSRLPPPAAPASALPAASSSRP